LKEKKEESEPIERDIVQRLLDRFIDSEEPAHVRVCFILALLQERKKILLVRGRGRDPDSGPYTIYEHRERGDTLIIRDPELTLSEAEAVEAEIKALMEQEKTAAEGSGENENPGEDREEVSEGDSPERTKDR